MEDLRQKSEWGATMTKVEEEENKGEDSGEVENGEL